MSQKVAFSQDKNEIINKVLHNQKINKRSIKGIHLISLSAIQNRQSHYDYKLFEENWELLQLKPLKNQAKTQAKKGLMGCLLIITGFCQKFAKNIDGDTNFILLFVTLPMMAYYMQPVFPVCRRHPLIFVLLSLMLILRVTCLLRATPVTPTPQGTRHCPISIENRNDRASAEKIWRLDCEPGYYLYKGPNVCLPDQQTAHWSSVSKFQSLLFVRQLPQHIVQYMFQTDQDFGTGNWELRLLSMHRHKLYLCGSLTGNQKHTIYFYFYYKITLLVKKVAYQFKILVGWPLSERSWRQAVVFGRKQNKNPSRLLSIFQISADPNLINKIDQIIVSNDIAQLFEKTKQKLNDTMFLKILASGFSLSISQLNGTNTSIPELQAIKQLKKKQPILKPIDQNIEHIVYLNLTRFQSTKLIKSMNAYLNIYLELFAGSEIVQASVGQNGSYYFVQYSYAVFDKNSYAYQTFIISKENFVLELVRRQVISNTNIRRTMIDFNNRPSYLANAQPKIKYLVAEYVEQNSYYDPEAQLDQVEVLKISPTVERIGLRYQIPQNLATPFQFIQFRYEIDPTNPRNTTQKGILFYPRQQFLTLNTSSKDQIDRMTLFLMFYGLISAEDSIAFISINVSKYRSSVKRVEFNLNNQWVYRYQIREGSNQNKLFYRRSFGADYQAYRIVENSNLPVDLSVPPARQIPDNFDLTFFMQQFPAKRTRPQRMIISPPSQAEQDGQLSELEIKKIINLFFRTPTASIYNVKIINRSNLRDFWDMYIVDYTELLPVRNTVFYRESIFRTSRDCRFSFQMESRRGNIILRAPEGSNLTTNTTPTITVRLSSSLTQPKPLNPIITVLPSQASSRTIKFWSAIFNKTFTIRGTAVKIDPPVRTARPPIIYSTLRQPITNMNIVIQDFLTHLPEVIPILFQESLQTANFQQLALGTIQPVSAQVIAIIEEASVPSIYRSQLVTSLVQRPVQGRPQYKMVQFKHFYFGSVRIWVSLDLKRLLLIRWLDNSYMMSSSSPKLLTQIPELSKAHALISEQLATIFYKYKYYGASVKNNQEQIVERRPQIDDIALWKYKRLKDTIEVEFVYAYIGFIVKAAIILNNNPDKFPAVVLVLLEPVNNQQKRAQQQAKKQKQILEIKARQQWPKIQAFYQSTFKRLKNSNLIDIYLQQTDTQLIYSLTFLTIIGRIHLNLLYNRSTSQISVITYQGNDQLTASLTNQGCLVENVKSSTCQECQSSYVLYPADEACYERVPNCAKQAGELCIMCDSGFVLTLNYECL